MATTTAGSRKSSVGLSPHVAPASGRGARAVKFPATFATMSTAFHVNGPVLFSDAVAAAVTLPLTETSPGPASSQCKLFAAGAEIFWVVKAEIAPAATRTAFVVN